MPKTDYMHEPCQTRVEFESDIFNVIYNSKVCLDGKVPRHYIQSSPNGPNVAERRFFLPLDGYISLSDSLGISRLGRSQQTKCVYEAV